jgi:hypothetical protein
VAALARLLGELYAAAELISGDPYAEVVGGNVHLGFRYFVRESLQLDVTAGTGLWGKPTTPSWVTAGVRLATPPLW